MCNRALPRNCAHHHRIICELIQPFIGTVCHKESQTCSPKRAARQPISRAHQNQHRSCSTDYTTIPNDCTSRSPSELHSCRKIQPYTEPRQKSSLCTAGTVPISD